ncbi:GTP cyclohydrolase II RibA [Acuticoccus sp.]|uniref:GTP cyclohydrolase II n=1 Tax=Acuticoccus sp. TaxID=1904378 RepID=UPI003B524636
MLTTTEPRLKVTDPGFVAAHRLVGEVAAGRPVLLRDGVEEVLASPIDGGPVLSGRLAVTGARAAYLGLTEAPTILAGPADADALIALAAADGVAAPRAEPAGLLAIAATELAKLAGVVPAMTLGAPADAAGTFPADVLAADASDVLALRRAIAVTARPMACASVPLAAGATATVTAYRNAVGGTVTTVAVGDPMPGALVRVHSSCATGDILGSQRCDCGAQLQLALRRIAQEGGLLVYTAQEGRGIGLVNKLRAYALQDRGLDTVEANLALGFHDDEREYAAAAAVLTQLGITDVRLMTNNPAKAAGLEALGITVVAVPLFGPVTEANRLYLATKRLRSGHRL